MVVLRHLYMYTQATCAPHSHRCPLRATGATLESPLFEQRHTSSRPRRSRATRPSRHRRPLPLTHLSSSAHRASAPRSFRPADSAANKASARPRRRSTKPRHNTGQRRYRQALRADATRARPNVAAAAAAPETSDLARMASAGARGATSRSPKAGSADPTTARHAPRRSVHARVSGACLASLSDVDKQVKLATGTEFAKQT